MKGEKHENSITDLLRNTVASVKKSEKLMLTQGSTSQWKSTCDLDEDLNSSTDGVIPLTQGISAFRRKSSSLINKPSQMLSHSSTASSYVSLPASNNGLNQTKSNNNANNKHGFDRQTMPTRPTATSLPQSSRNSIHFETVSDKSVDDNFHRRRASAFSTPSSSNMTLTFLKDFNNKRTGKDAMKININYLLINRLN
ncbi:unnamed protein product [Trichobilharzia regenti]|nr:unnamed protein product [Trichobilharzia regenti]